MGGDDPNGNGYSNESRKESKHSNNSKGSKGSQRIPFSEYKFKVAQQ
jgi:hypothetical protein